MKTNNRILLKPVISRLQKVFLFLFGTVFMGLFAWAFMTDSGTPKPVSYFLLFLCVLFFISTIQSLIALKSTKIELSVNSKDLKHGEVLDLYWESSHKADRLKKLTLSIFQMESRTSGSGNNKKTNSKKLHDEILFETTDLNEILSGSKSITIPKIFKHSYSSDGYNLGWFLKVKGEIPMSPDIDEDYKILISKETLIPTSENSA